MTWQVTGNAVSAVTEYVAAIAAGDLDNDGDIDIVMGSFDHTAGAGKIVIRNDGAGAYSPVTNTPITQYNNRYSLNPM